VLIEAKILEIALGDSVSFGVDWEKTFEAGNYAGTMSTKSFALPENTEGAQGFFLDVFKNNQKLKANLDALESRSDLNVLATPKILAVDGKSAEILIGGRLGYYVVTTTETSTLQNVEFLDTGTQLKITPHISKEGKILMEIHPEVSDGTIDALGLPSTRTTEVTTSVLAEHGDTIFIGGLIRQAKEKNRKKIPLLGSIPLIGSFFGRTEDKEAKSEIIILITPYVVSPDEKMIYEAKKKIVERAEASHQDKRTTVEKLFYHEKMFDKIQGKDEGNALGIQKRGKISPPPANNKTAQEFEPAARYSLLVSSFYEAENAEAFTKKLQQKGYPAYLLATQDKTGNPLMAVKVGPLKTQEIAEEYTNRLKTEEGITALTIEE
jgi:Flp pilus assembly secretin CpaC